MHPFRVRPSSWSAPVAAAVVRAVACAVGCVVACVVVVAVSGCAAPGDGAASPNAATTGAAAAARTPAGRAPAGVAATSATGPAAPRADKRPTPLEKHGHVRIDEYYWLNRRDDPAVLAYLEAENAYTEAVMAERDLQETLLEEIVARIPQEDTDAPYRKDDFFYYRRFATGAEYPIHARRRAIGEAMAGVEQVLLDVERLARGHAFFSVRGVEVSSGQHLLSYAIDTRGRRIYTLHFKDLRTGATLPDVIQGVTGNVAWAEDDRTLFYTRQDPVTLRSHEVWRHVLGTDPSEDVLVYREDDTTFSCSVSKTRSKRYLLIVSRHTLTTEYRYLAADDPGGELRVFEPRARGHEYRVDHLGEHFFVSTNWDAQNFRLMRTPVTATGREHWQEVIPHRRDVMLLDFAPFADHLVVGEREDGLPGLRVIPWDGGDPAHRLTFDEPVYDARLGQNFETDTSTLRFEYASLTTPKSVYDYDMQTRERTLKKRDEVLGGFDSNDYVSERVHATARDGTRVPISLVYRAGFERDNSRPLLLYGYGSYGASMDARFRPEVLSLLDRGFVYAIAHVRGGEELGRWWYEDGKLLRKKNTFTDFVDCGTWLIERGYAHPDELFAQGGSAGGLLMGAVVNIAPELFCGVVAGVPFVDVVTTMLDDSIPLTTSEYDEWGDPNDPEYYRYMLSYSPYDNVERKAYPHLLVTTGLHDSQVQYFEPAKWVARLRDRKTDDRLLLLHCEMEAGHGGKSGRFRRFEETALEYAFLLRLASRDGGTSPGSQATPASNRRRATAR